MISLNSCVLKSYAYLNDKKNLGLSESDINKVSKKAFINNGFIKYVKFGNAIECIEEKAFENAKELVVFEIDQNYKEKAFEIAKELVVFEIDQNYKEKAFENAKELVVFEIDQNYKEKAKSSFRLIKKTDESKGTNLTIQYKAFCNCTKLISVILDVDKRVVIEKEAFHNCIALETILISDKDAEIDNDAFSGCSILRIIAPKGGKVESFARNHEIELIELCGF